MLIVKRLEERSGARYIKEALEMKRSKHLILAVITLMLAFAGSTLGQNQNATGSRLKGMRLLRMFRIERMQFAKNLDLTPGQKTQIKSILANQKTQIRQSVRDVAKARHDLTSQTPGAEAEFAKARAASVYLKMQLFKQIKPVLNSDQLAKAQQRIQIKRQRLQKMRDRFNSTTAS
jgi:hypothetical protein